jgi:hypothetical protein
MALDPGPIAKLAAELMDQLEEDLPDATFEDALIVVEVSYPDPSDGEYRSEIRTKSTSERSTIVIGLTSIAHQIAADPGLDDEDE